DLRADLSELLRRAEALSAALRTGAAPTGVAAVVAAIEQVRADDLLVDGVHAEIEQQLESSATAIARQAAARGVRRQRLDALVAQLDAVVAATEPLDRGRLQTALEALVTALHDAVTPSERAPLGVTLPYRSVNLPAVAPVTQPAVVPAYLDTRPRPS